MISRLLLQNESLYVRRWLQAGVSVLGISELNEVVYRNIHLTPHSIAQHVVSMHRLPSNLSRLCASLQISGTSLLLYPSIKRERASINSSTKYASFTKVAWPILAPQTVPDNTSSTWGISQLTDRQQQTS